MHQTHHLHQHIRQAPLSLGLSLLALAFYTMPALGGMVEFLFADLHCPDSSSLLEEPFKTWQTLSWWRSCLRIAGCNWLHWTFDHLFWDVAMFYGLGSICERRNRGLFLLTTVLVALTIPIAVAATSPDLQSYRGLSGIDTALFALLATDLLLKGVRRRDWTGCLIFLGLLCGLAAKIGYELFSLQLVFVSDATFTPVPIAHLIGAGMGILLSGWKNLMDGYPLNLKNPVHCGESDCPITFFRSMGSKYRVSNPSRRPADSSVT